MLLIWCDLFFGLDDDTTLEDRTLWQKKRREFAELYRCYEERFGVDSSRVYLTGFSFAGAYSWMLAYDRPDQFAGVVAMSAVSYPEQIQKALKSGESVVTVVVIGEADAWFEKRRVQEKETGRIVESKNPHSRFVVKSGEDHGSVEKYWVEYLKYVLKCQAR